jgi:hypothetical protein
VSKQHDRLVLLQLSRPYRKMELNQDESQLGSATTVNGEAFTSNLP